MPTYAIGDVQGCYDELQSLLSHIQFDKNVDTLWFVGDLVNRGPKSLETLRFVKSLPQVKVVLGNHDLHLLALAYDDEVPHHTLSAILQAPDKDELIHWLRRQSLLHYDANLNYVMVHAGLPPQWDLTLAQQCAAEVEKELRGTNIAEFLEHMYGNQPDQWNDNLKKHDRGRFIINAFTRMRFCTPTGQLDFACTGPIGSQPEGLMPWFDVPNRRSKNLNIIFGHWAALKGEVNYKGIFALDTGCVWGNCLTAMRLEDAQRFSVPCLRSNVTKE